MRRLRADPKALEALSIDPASVQAQEEKITSVLHRVMSEAAISDPAALAQRRRSAAKGTPRERLHHQIPASALGVGTIGPIDEDQAELWRVMGSEPPLEGSKVRSVVYEDAHLRAIRRYFVPEVIRVVHAHVSQVRPAVEEREAHKLAETWGRDRRGQAERRKELKRRVSATLNRLTADLVRGFYPFWARDLTPRRVRVTIENLARRRIAAS